MTDYNDQSFWEKVKTFAITAGSEVINLSIQLYYTAQAPATPPWAKSVIYGALAYFILPIDAIPDLIPVVGYSDDLGALAAAVGAVTAYITPEIKKQADAKMKEWFG